MNKGALARLLGKRYEMKQGIKLVQVGALTEDKGHWSTMEASVE